MRILLSAYACEPDKGSEPGVGWNWATELSAQKNEVWVITRTNNRDSIEKEMEANPRDNLHFIYYDLPRWIQQCKKKFLGVHLYYFLWQVGIFTLARSLVKNITFDVIHHVTFVSVRQPSFLGLLGSPFIFGPVAGGEQAPMILRKAFPWRGWFVDAFRDLANAYVKISPLMRITFHSAEIIYVTSEQSRRLIPKRYQEKTVVKLAIGTDSQHPNHHHELSSESIGPVRVLYVGQLLYWKGVHLALRSFSHFLKGSPDSRLTIVGRGPEEKRLRKLARHLNIDHAVEWQKWLPRSELDKVYQQHHALLFPSLHDSGGMVVLEAMNSGLPVVCLDLGGPGCTVNSSCGYKIDTTDRSEKEVVFALSEALSNLFHSPQHQMKLSQGATEQAKSFGWPILVSSIYGSIS
ncbi:glycosyltransferase family 4 protein [Photobacterium sp. OFAV2-7]|uniref:glycosyltransferase family 4 protein n=1 Tax=Photobacterium sp. OFAV2-7 TaxID=2917748 RepID=UPI001EF6585D|nr:glycosyltransferase family 4 protein [Photobacterium sp. OFAV2-7]MCG7587660.1 glycosyltransferase family 4 protein [Photobacterium sp. OFAV2-7]